MLKRKTGLKRTPFRRKLNVRREDYSKMIELFQKHWETHPDRKCEACGVQLYGENKTYYHDHLLEKSKYEELTYEIDNLFLCCMNCHNSKSMGNPKPLHQKAIEEAIKRFL